MLVVLGLGSNLGDRLALLRSAVAALECPPDPTGELRVLRRSQVVESAPAGGPPQGDYLNAAVLCRTSLAPAELLALAHRVERSLGRIRPEPARWAARTIDIDLLWIRGRLVEEPDLRVPHPRLRERPFALGPVVELVPDAVDPQDGTAYRELVRHLPALPQAGLL